MPEFGYRGSVFNDVCSIYERAQNYEKNLLHSAIHVLLANEDDSLRLLLGLLAIGQHQCDGRRRMSLSILLNAVRKHLLPTRMPSASSSQAFEGEVPAAEAVTAAKGGEESCIPGANKVYQIASTFIENRKELAYRSAFVEPSLLYFNATSDSVMEGDVEVHGSNYYLALLQASTGIRIGRIPLFNDVEVKGVAAFLDASGPNNSTWDAAMSEVLAQRNIGKSSLALISRPRANLVVQRVPSNAFIFTQSFFDSPMAMARRAIDPSPQFKTQRVSYARYLENFTSYFSADNLLNPLLNAVLQDVSGGAEALQSVFLHLKRNEMLPVECAADCEDVRHFLWDVEQDVPVFNVQAAQALFSFCGITKPIFPLGNKRQDGVGEDSDASCTNTIFLVSCGGGESD